MVTVYCLWTRGLPQDLGLSKDCEKSIASRGNEEGVQWEWASVQGAHGCTPEPSLQTLAEGQVHNHLVEYTVEITKRC